MYQIIIILIWVCLKIEKTPFYPMVLLIIIPFLNGYLFGNIAYFQTKPYSKITVFHDFPIGTPVKKILYTGREKG